MHQIPKLQGVCKSLIYSTEMGRIRSITHYNYKRTKIHVNSLQFLGNISPHPTWTYCVMGLWTNIFNEKWFFPCCPNHQRQQLQWLKYLEGSNWRALNSWLITFYHLLVKLQLSFHGCKWSFESSPRMMKQSKGLQSIQPLWFPCQFHNKEGHLVP